MDYAKLDQSKGVAGLNVFLSLIAMVFTIGILVMALAISGSQMRDAVNDSVAETVINQTVESIDDAPTWFPTFIALGAVVVLVALIAIFIGAIRQTGLMAGGGA